MSPFVNSFKELIEKIRKDFLDEGSFGIYISRNDDSSIFEELLVQELIRNVDGQDVVFLALRNIVLKEQFKGHKLLSSFLSELEEMNCNIMFHDIINPKLYAFLEKRGYVIFQEEKYDHQIKSMIRMKTEV